jgi:hypothetical protein
MGRHGAPRLPDGAEELTEVRSNLLSTLVLWEEVRAMSKEKLEFQLQTTD